MVVLSLFLLNVVISSFPMLCYFHLGFWPSLHHSAFWTTKTSISSPFPGHPPARRQAARRFQPCACHQGRLAQHCHCRPHLPLQPAQCARGESRAWRLCVALPVYGPRQNGDPVATAQAWFNGNLGTIKGNPAVDYWEGYNEPDGGSVQAITWLAQFEAERVRLLASELTGNWWLWGVGHAKSFQSRDTFPPALPTRRRRPRQHRQLWHGQPRRHQPGYYQCLYARY